MEKQARMNTFLQSCLFLFHFHLMFKIAALKEVRLALLAYCWVLPHDGTHQSNQRCSTIWRAANGEELKLVFRAPVLRVCDPSLLLWFTVYHHQWGTVVVTQPQAFKKPIFPEGLLTKACLFLFVLAWFSLQTSRNQENFVISPTYRWDIMCCICSVRCQIGDFFSKWSSTG